jgi:hypothetical protein
MTANEHRGDHRLEEDVLDQLVRQHALRTLCEMVGALVLARAVGKTTPSLADDLLSATSDGLRLRRPDASALTASP